MANLLESFRIDINHPLQTHAYYDSYLAEEIETGHKFRADFIKKEIITQDQRIAFEECINNLKNARYYPIWLPFHDGILTPDRKGILLWRCKANLISLRDAINSNNDVLQYPHCIWFLAFISKAFNSVSHLNIDGHLNLTIDNVLIDEQSKIPVLIRYGLQKLWIALYGDEGKIPSLICPPEKMNIDQSSIDHPGLFDSYAFGILMYQILTKQILDENQPFNRELLDNNLVNYEDLFLREIIIASTHENPEKRQRMPFSSFSKIFVTILQQQMKPILFRTYCQSCVANGDEKARQFLESSNRSNQAPIPFIYGLPDRVGTCQKPTPISFIIGKKVIHNIDAFQNKLSSLDPNKRVIFITIFGGYQMGKSTTLCLLSGNNNYVIGNGNEETTRGVSIDGPYQLDRFTEAFGRINNYPNLDEAFPLNANERLSQENPYVFLIDVEGFNGDVIGYDDETNKRLYKDLVKPYLALSTNVLFMCYQNEALSSRQFVIENLSIQNFSNVMTGSFFNLSMIIRNVRTYSSLSGEFPFDDPFNREQDENLSVQFLDRFGRNFQDNGISVTVCPLGDFLTHTQTGVNNNGIPIFDKSFIVMARKLISQVYSLCESLHITNSVGAIEMFRNLCYSIAAREANGYIITDEEDTILIQDAQTQAHRRLILHRVTSSKVEAYNFITDEISHCDIDKINPLDISNKRSEWLGMFTDKFNTLNKDKGIESLDRFEIAKNVGEIAAIEVNQFISDTFSQKITKDAQSKLALLVTNRMYEFQKEIESSILNDSTWKYYIDNYPNQKSLVDNCINKIKEEIAKNQEFSNIKNQAFQQFQETLLTEGKKVLENELERIFEITNIIMASQKGITNVDVRDANEIPGNDEFVLTTVDVTMEGPKGEVKKTFRKARPKPFIDKKKNECLLI